MKESLTPAFRADQGENMKVDEIVFLVCLLLGVWYFGFLYGQHSVKCVMPEIKKLSVHTMDARKQKLWVRYLAKEKQ